MSLPLPTLAIDEIGQRFQELSALPPEAHSEADALLLALAMLLAGRIEAIEEQVQVIRIITNYRKVKGMGTQPLRRNTP